MGKFFKELLEEKFGSRSRGDNGKSPTDSPEYYATTVKAMAMADVGGSNSILGKSAGKEEMVQCLEKTIMRKVNFTKRYDMRRYKQLPGLYW